MFNRKLKLRIKELESQLSDHLRSICSLREQEIQNARTISEIHWRTKHVKAPVKTSETEDSKTFEYPYKYTYSNAKKEKEIPVDVRDKVLNKLIKPPIGLTPRYIIDTERFNEVRGAIVRFYDAETEIPVKWIEEYNELIRLTKR
jgi:hypothetical protein